jgi:hypothetical protein
LTVTQKHDIINLENKRKEVFKMENERKIVRLVLDGELAQRISITPDQLKLLSWFYLHGWFSDDFSYEVENPDMEVIKI